MCIGWAKAFVKRMFRSGREVREAISLEALDRLSMHLEGLIAASRLVVASSHATLEANG